MKKFFRRIRQFFQDAEKMNRLASGIRLCYQIYRAVEIIVEMLKSFL